MSDGSKPLTDGATYYYRITCFNEAGSESLPSDAVSATTRPLLPSPQQLKATSGQPGKVTINWESTPEFKEKSKAELGDYEQATGNAAATMLKVALDVTPEARQWVRKWLTEKYSVKF